MARTATRVASFRNGGAIRRRRAGIRFLHLQGHLRNAEMLLLQGRPQVQLPLPQEQHKVQKPRLLLNERAQFACLQMRHACLQMHQLVCRCIILSADETELSADAECLSADVSLAFAE